MLTASFGYLQVLYQYWNMENHRQNIWKERFWCVTMIIRMSLLMANSGGMCSSPHCVLTPYALWTNTAVDVRGEMASQGGAHRTARWVILLSEHLHPQSLSNYPDTHYTISPYVLPRFNPCFASCCQQPNVTALSAIPLIIAQRSPWVESNCGVQGVNGAKTSEESPLEDDKKTADWLQTTQRGIRAFHMNLNAILTGNLPLEREKGKDSKRDRASERERD